MEWRPAGWSVCQPLLISPCTVKSRSSLLAPAHPGGPGKRAVSSKRCCAVFSECRLIPSLLAVFVCRWRSQTWPLNWVATPNSRTCGLVRDRSVVFCAVFTSSRHLFRLNLGSAYTFVAAHMASRLCIALQPVLWPFDLQIVLWIAVIWQWFIKASLLPGVNSSNHGKLTS